MPKQDANVKGNPWLLTRNESGNWLVPSATTGRVYTVNTALSRIGDYRLACQCEASQHDRLCWHASTAELREQLDDCLAKCLRHYARWTIAELQAEDLRLRVIMSVEGAGPFLLTQYTSVGDTLAAKLAHAAA